MGDEPAAWMDEFRPELRWLAARELAASRRLEQSSFYDQEEEERITTAELAAHGFDPDQFWSRFNAAAFKHGYKRPKVGPGYWHSGIEQWLASCWPTFVAIAVLTGTLRLFSQRRFEREV